MKLNGKIMDFFLLHLIYFIIYFISLTNITKLGLGISGIWYLEFNII